MNLPPGIFQYLLIGQAIIPFFINIVVNVVLGVLTFGGKDAVPTWAMDKGAASDSIGTCFFLPFITCLIATPLVRRDVKRGRVAGIPEGPLPWWGRALGGPLLLRAVKFGIAGIVLLAGPVYGVYALLAGDSIETSRFLFIKALSSGVFGFLVTPLIAIVALADEPRK